MLVLVSTCFLLLNAPAHFFVIALKIYTTPSTSAHLTLNGSNSTSIMTNTTMKYSSNLTSTSIDDYASLSPEMNELTLLTNHSIEDDKHIHLLFTAVLSTQFLSYLSYSINFFLYSLSGITFRTSLRQLMRKLGKY